MDLSKYLDLFVSEARNHISAFDDLTVSLEKTGNDPAAINELFRHMHSLKGMAGTMQFNSVAELAHTMEDLLNLVRNGQLSITGDMADLLLTGNDLLAAMVTALESGHPSRQPDPSELISRIRQFSSAPPSPPQPPQPVKMPAVESTATTEEDTSHPFRQSDMLKNIRIRSETLDRLTDITGELFTIRYQLEECVRNISAAPFQTPMKQLSVLLRELRNVVLQARMLQFSHLAERFPRMVRDLARSLGKEVDFEISGQEIELDRTILEAINEPLVHLLRNAIDHGIETPEQRSLQGKSPGGKVILALLRAKDHITISIADDGRGMDPAKLAAQAVSRGLITAVQAEKMLPQELFQLIFEPGFSTAERVSEVSGRGVGMDAVRHAVHALGGSIAIDSFEGLGSMFVLKIPASVAIIHALLAEYKGQTIALPVNTIDRTAELRREEIASSGQEQYFTLAGIDIPLYGLDCSAPPKSPDQEIYYPVIISGLDTSPFGIAVDSIIGQQEIFVKPLGLPLSHLRSCTGGSISGDGRIIFVMDINCLKQSL